MLLSSAVLLDNLLPNPTRFLFFTGKGDVGKTSLSSAAAGWGRRTRMT
ncbi:MAG TPA: hypothetical protein VI689_01085 [Acidimicrobiia bacterium]|nr:hypothetical protein [Acidimicrobiia bacterium]